MDARTRRVGWSCALVAIGATLLAAYRPTTLEPSPDPEAARTLARLAPTPTHKPGTSWEALLKSPRYAMVNDYDFDPLGVDAVQSEEGRLLFELLDRFQHGEPSGNEWHVTQNLSILVRRQTVEWTAKGYPALALGQCEKTLKVIRVFGRQSISSAHFAARAEAEIMASAAYALRSPKLSPETARAWMQRNEPTFEFDADQARRGEIARLLGPSPEGVCSRETAQMLDYALRAGRSIPSDAKIPDRIGRHLVPGVTMGFEHCSVKKRRANWALVESAFQASRPKKPGRTG